MEFFSEWIAPFVLFGSIAVIISLGLDSGYGKPTLKDWRFWVWLLWLFVWYKFSGGN